MTPSLTPAAVLQAALVDSRLSTAMAELTRLTASGCSRARIANSAWEAREHATALVLALADVWVCADEEERAEGVAA